MWGISISSHTLSSSLTPLLTLPRVTLVWLEGQNKSEWIWCKQPLWGKSVALVSFPKCLKTLSLKMSRPLDEQPARVLHCATESLSLPFATRSTLQHFFPKLFFSEGKVWPQLTPGSPSISVWPSNAALYIWEKYNWNNERNAIDTVREIQFFEVWPDLHMREIQLT